MYYASYEYVFEIMCKVYNNRTSKFSDLFSQTRNYIENEGVYECQKDQMLKKIYNQQIKKACEQYNIKLDEKYQPTERGNYPLRTLPVVKSLVFRRQRLEQISEIAGIDYMGIDLDFVVFKTKPGTSNLFANFLITNYPDHIFTAIPTENATIVIFNNDESSTFMKEELGFYE